jgi:hypothetical protein
MQYAKARKLDCVTHGLMLTYTNKTLASFVVLGPLWRRDRKSVKLAANMKKTAAHLADIKQYQKIWNREYIEKSATLHATLLRPIYL